MKEIKRLLFSLVKYTVTLVFIYFFVKLFNFDFFNVVTCTALIIAIDNNNKEK